MGEKKIAICETITEGGEGAWAPREGTYVLPLRGWGSHEEKIDRQIVISFSWKIVADSY